MTIPKAMLSVYEQGSILLDLLFLSPILYLLAFSMCTAASAGGYTFKVWSFETTERYAMFMVRQQVFVQVLLFPLHKLSFPLLYDGSFHDFSLS